jgi:prepilin-type N-terminal cleavage/methylation domain-containing protein
VLVTRRLRQDAGFTLPELLVVIFISGIVLAGAASFVNVILRQSSGTMLRTEATQRGRLVLDRITQSIRSQVCVDVDTASEKGSLVSASSNAIQFYVDLSNGTVSPERREISYDATNKRIVEKRWAATTAPGVTPTTWSATVTQRTLLDNVIPYKDGSAPIFRYYGYQPTGDPRLDTLRFDPGAGTLTATQLEDTARVAVAVEVLPQRAPASNKISTRLEDSVHLRTSDPNKSNPDPECRA